MIVAKRQNIAGFKIYLASTVAQNYLIEKHNNNNNRETEWVRIVETCHLHQVNSKILCFWRQMPNGILNSI